MTCLQQHAEARERRKAQRCRTLKSAKIVFNRRSSVIDCTVRNLSGQGARLRVPNPIGVPERFELLVDGAIRHAATIWRASNEVGVAFLRPAD